MLFFILIDLTIFGYTLLQMKLRYTISETTDLSREILIEHILKEIDKRDYGLISNWNNTIKFDSTTSGLRWRWRWENNSRLDSGTFEIVVCDDHNILNFEYYPITLFEYLWVLFLVTACIVAGGTNAVFFIPYFMAFLFLAQLIFKYFNLKSIAKDMLNEILLPCARNCPACHGLQE